MRINFDHGAQDFESSRAESSRAPANAAGSLSSPSMAAAGADQAQFSAAHAQIIALAAQAAQLPEIRTERVESLRQALLGGSYHRTNEELAGAIVAHMLTTKAA